MTEAYDGPWRTRRIVELTRSWTKPDPELLRAFDRVRGWHAALERLCLNTLNRERHMKKTAAQLIAESRDKISVVSEGPLRPITAVGAAADYVVGFATHNEQVVCVQQGNTDRNRGYVYFLVWVMAPPNGEYRLTQLCWRAKGYDGGKGSQLTAKFEEGSWWHRTGPARAFESGFPTMQQLSSAKTYYDWVMDHNREMPKDQQRETPDFGDVIFQREGRPSHLSESSGLMKPVPKGAEYGGTRYAYGCGPNREMWEYDHDVGSLILFGPPVEGEDESGHEWQLSFFSSAGDEWQMNSDKDHGDLRKALQKAERTANRISGCEPNNNGLSDLELFLEDEGFERI